MSVDGNLDVLWHAAISKGIPGEHDATWPSWIPWCDALDSRNNMICTAMLGGKPHSSYRLEYHKLEHLPQINGIRVNGIVIGTVSNVAVLEKHIRDHAIEKAYGSNISSVNFDSCLDSRPKDIVDLLGSLTCDAVLEELNLERLRATCEAVLKALPSVSESTASGELIPAVQAANILASNDLAATSTGTSTHKSATWRRTY